MRTMALTVHTLARVWVCFFDTRTCNKISLSISLMIILTSKSLFCGVPSSPELSSTLAALWRSCMAVLVWHKTASFGQCMCRKSRLSTLTSDATSVNQIPIALHSHSAHPQKHNKHNERNTLSMTPLAYCIALALGIPAKNTTNTTSAALRVYLSLFWHAFASVVYAFFSIAL